MFIPEGSIEEYKLFKTSNVSLQEIPLDHDSWKALQEIGYTIPWLTD